MVIHINMFHQQTREEEEEEDEQQLSLRHSHIYVFWFLQIYYRNRKQAPSSVRSNFNSFTENRGFVFHEMF